jgi:hypothetical protein
MARIPPFARDALKSHFTCRLGRLPEKLSNSAIQIWVCFDLKIGKPTPYSETGISYGFGRCLKSTREAVKRFSFVSPRMEMALKFLLRVADLGGKPSVR